MGRKRTAGLRRRGGIWHIEKQVKGYGVLRESCKTGDYAVAEQYLYKRLDELRQQMMFGVRPVRTFRQAATKYLEETTKRSIGRDAQALVILDPHIGDMPIEKVHMGTLRSYVTHRKAAGIKSGTVSRELAVVRRILNLAARMWRDESDKPWIDTAPLIQLPDWDDAKQPYPLSWDEQRALFKALPDHLHRMALFKVNSGAREQEVCGLRWDWEVEIPELGTTVFVLPGNPHGDWKGTKNKEDRVIVLNRIARSVVDELRGTHPKYVFTYKGHRVGRMFNNAWKRARAEVGLPQVRVHDLKHTCGRRLRAAGVPLETRKILLRHTNGDITTHYSAPELQELINAMERIVGMESGKAPAMTLLRAARERTSA
jgi:integrase